VDLGLRLVRIGHAVKLFVVRARQRACAAVIVSASLRSKPWLPRTVA
jgi:hypothetical protein